MRILMFCSYFPPQYSGAAKQAISLAHQLRKLGCTIEFVTKRDLDLPGFEYYQDFPVHRIEINGRRNREFPFWWNFFKFAWQNHDRFDIFHSHGAYYINSIVGPIARLIGWKSLVKSTMFNNDLYGLKKTKSGRLHYLFLKMVNAYIAISSDLVQEFKGYGFNKDRIHYIPNGVDSDRFFPIDHLSKKILRKKLGLPEEPRIILSVGVFDKRKNIGWLIEEWEKTRQSNSGNFLLAIGPKSREDKGGRFLNSLKKIAVLHEKELMILDHVEKIEEYYRACDIFVLPSTNEGLPNVVLEAMASGLPCLASRASGVQDLVSEGDTGFLFERNDHVSFSKKLAMFSSENIRIMGDNARKVAEEKFSIQAVARQYIRLYNDLVS